MFLKTNLGRAITCFLVSKMCFTLKRGRHFHNCSLNSLPIISTELFTVLEKLNLVRFAYALWWFGFKREPIFTTTIAALKNDAYFKSCQKKLDNNHLVLLLV